MGCTLECISYLMTFLSYLVNIYHCLITLTVILHRLWSNLIFSLLPVSLLLIYHRSSQCLKHRRIIFATRWYCKQFSKAVPFFHQWNFQLVGCGFNSIRNCLIVSIICCIWHSTRQWYHITRNFRIDYFSKIVGCQRFWNNIFKNKVGSS